MLSAKETKDISKQLRYSFEDIKINSGNLDSKEPKDETIRPTVFYNFSKINEIYWHDYND